MTRRFRAATLCAAVVLVGEPCTAQPAIDELRIIAPAAPGGGWDQTARAMQQVLQQGGIAPGSRVVNVAGAGGTVGLARLVNSDKGKGDVLLVTGLIMVGAVLTNKSPVGLAQTTPIARLVGEYELLVVPAASPHRTLKAFLEAWKANPGRMAIAGGSAGGTDHMLAGLLAKAVGIDPARINYIPHSGGGESVASLLGSQVAAGINGAGELTAFIRAGQIRALAVSSDTRVPGLDVPTFVEQGVNLSLSNWRGVVAAPGISDAQRAALSSAIDRMRQLPAWKETLTRNNWTDVYQSGAAFKSFIEQEQSRAAGVLRSIGLVK
jgi:putative tricarboxylic transport membrane protein